MSPEQKQTCLITFFNYRTYTCLRVNVEGNLISDYSILPLFLQTTNHFYFIADKATRLLKFVNTVMLFFVFFFNRKGDACHFRSNFALRLCSTQMYSLCVMLLH